MARGAGVASRSFAVAANAILVTAFWRRLMVGVAQLAERQVVVLDVVGSSPITHPKSNAPELQKCGSGAFLRPSAGHHSGTGPDRTRPMAILANLVSYGLGFGAPICLAIAFTRLARRPRTTPNPPPLADPTSAIAPTQGIDFN